MNSISWRLHEVLVPATSPLDDIFDNVINRERKYSRKQGFIKATTVKKENG